MVRRTDPFDYFLLDSETGELRTAKPLDREALEDSTGVLTLKVKAREMVEGKPGNDDSTVSMAEATVTIKDVNDEPPSFNRREYNIEIPENVPDGTPLPHLDMSVKDPDVVSCHSILANQLFRYLSILLVLWVFFPLFPSGHSCEWSSQPSFQFDPNLIDNNIQELTTLVAILFEINELVRAAKMEFKLIDLSYLDNQFESIWFQG